MTVKKNTYTRRRNRRKRGLTPAAKTVLIISVVFIAIGFFAYAAENNWFGGNAEKYSGDIAELYKVAVPDDVCEEIVNYTGFTVSFNPEHHIPNYVVWELTGDETDGKEPRYNKFSADDDVSGCPTLDDYRNSGYDRGHMAPAADMKWDRQAMIDSHYLTNICPQTHSLNGGAWASLENKCREWARRDSAIIIICGPVLTDRITRHIGDSEVSVPERFFKVILSPFSEPVRGIGFIMPNGTVAGGMQKAAVSIDEVEAITGYDFFSSLPDEIENEVESQANFNQWNRRRK